VRIAVTELPDHASVAVYVRVKTVLQQPPLDETTGVVSTTDRRVGNCPWLLQWEGDQCCTCTTTSNTGTPTNSGLVLSTTVIVCVNEASFFHATVAFQMRVMIAPKPPFVVLYLVVP
jgi:hypothetical protein